MKGTLLAVLILASVALFGCTFQDLTNRAPEAVIDASPREGQAPLTVQFDARYSHDDGLIAEYYWDFGDPHDSVPLSTSTAIHTYRHPGTYLVKLSVIDEKGELDSEMIAIKVANPPPVASFEVSNEYPSAWVLVTFDASASYDSNGEIVGYAWDFGDGNSGSGVSTTHAYTEEGDYTVILAVTDDEEATATTRRTITVQQGGSGGCGGGTCDDYGDPPLAVISGLPTCQGGTVGVPIKFDGSYSRAADGMIVSYSWDFGDGETATGAIVRHAYERTGRYKVILTIHDSSGQQASAYGIIDIQTNYY